MGQPIVLLLMTTGTTISAYQDGLQIFNVGWFQAGDPAPQHLILLNIIHLDTDGVS